MKKIVAFIIDIFISFGMVGYLVALLSGQTTANGFVLKGIPAILVFIEIILYFTILKKKLGKTLGQKIMKI